MISHSPSRTASRALRTLSPARKETNVKRFHDVNRPSSARGLVLATLVTLFMPLLAWANASPAFARAGKASSPPTRTGFNTKHDVSKPLREMVKVFKKGPAAPPHEIPNRIRTRGPGAPPPLASDPLLRSFTPIGVMPSPILTFEGGSDDDNENIVGFRLAPPDNNGDVGP